MSQVGLLCLTVSLIKKKFEHDYKILCHFFLNKFNQKEWVGCGKNYFTTNYVYFVTNSFTAITLKLFIHWQLLQLMLSLYF